MVLGLVLDLAWFGLGLGLRFAVVLEFKKTAKMKPRRVPGGSRGPSGELEMSLKIRLGTALGKLCKRKWLQMLCIIIFDEFPTRFLGRVL